MGVPKFDQLFQITLDSIKFSGGTASIYAIEKYVADHLNLSEEDRNEIHNHQEGGRTELGYRLAWARYYLKNAGLIESNQRTLWSLTALGVSTSDLNVDQIKSVATSSQIEKSVKNDDIETDIYNEDVEAEDDSSDTIIDEPFDPKLVDITSKPLILEAIFKRLKNKEIDLLTGFQRKGGLWDDTKQSRLIESILIRFPLPAFYFDGSNDNKWLIVDGLQRITALKRFVIDLDLRLENLEFLHQYNNFKFSDLPRDLQRRIEEFEITIYVINAGTPEKVKYNVFKRINTGGLVLSAQEIRHALNQGKASELVRQLAESDEFQKATTYSISSDRMMDRDFVNRFIAFYLKDPIKNYKPDLDTYLNEAMAELNKLDDKSLNEIQKIFTKAMNTSFELFNVYAFRKRFDITETRRKPINKALFEVWSTSLAKLNDAELVGLIENKELLNTKFLNLMNSDDHFLGAISSGTGGVGQVRIRFREIKKIISEVLNHDQKN
ncbi:MAG: DUF262 domain-containing protein [Flavobacteriia bacterium]|nr:DUF262 domain-containing protein [Flavobacteriia bacterium]